MFKKPTCTFTVLLTALAFTFSSFAQTTPLGIFEGQSEVGPVKLKGDVKYDAQSQHYTVSGSGADVFFAKDELHFVWKKIKGDFILRANGAFVGADTHMYGKFGLMVRTSLAGNSAQVNAVVHGNKLTALQYRKTTGDSTMEQRTDVQTAGVLQLERKGNTYTMSVAKKGDVFGPEKTVELNLGDEVYVGLFVCSHVPDKIKKVEFNNVRLVVPAPATLKLNSEFIGSYVELLDMATQNSRIVYQSPVSIQAPNWMKDGKSLIYNSDGALYKFNLATSTPAVLNTGAAVKNNNDHVISFDGKSLVISDNTKGASIGYTVPITGGQPKQITNASAGASYMHGWSPDGKYLVFCGERGGEYDVYRIPANGGPEERFTTTPGLDDGPEYTPDGKYIYFNSVRSGLMQVWRMDADGKNQTQITNDDFNNWFPHVSPDGKSIVFITFLKTEVKPGDHPFYKHVYIRTMPVGGGPIKTVAYLYGGQGTINTPSWSPDGKHIAFVSNSDLLFSTFPKAKN